MDLATSQASMLTCLRNKCTEVIWSGSKMALTNTLGPPRPVADNHWYGWRRGVRRRRRNPMINELGFGFSGNCIHACWENDIGLGWKEFPEGSKDVESILRVSNVAGSTSVRKDRDRLCCAFEVDGERIAEEMLCLAHIVDKVASIMPIALMKGKPRIWFTVTSGPAATRRDVSLTSLVR